MKRLYRAFWAIKYVLRICPIVLTIGFGCMIIARIVPVVLAKLTGYSLSMIQNYNNAPMQWTESFVLPLLALGFAYWMESFLNYAYGIIMQTILMRLNIAVKEKFAEALTAVPLIELDSPEKNDYFERARAGTENMAAFGVNLSMFLAESIGLIAASFVAVSVSIRLLPLILFSFLAGAFLQIRKQKIEYVYWQRTTEKRRYSEYLASLVYERNSAKEIRAYTNMYPFLSSKREAINHELRNGLYKEKVRGNRLFAFYQLVVDLTGFLIIGVCLYEIRTGVMQVGDICTVWLLYRTIQQSVQVVTEAFSELVVSDEKITDTRSFIEGYSSLEEKNVVVDNAQSDGVALELKDVSFSYESKENALRDISIQIHKGEIVAICGRNGSGKTTLIKILLGLYTPNKGQVFINGKSVKEGEQNEIGVAFQEEVRYPMTVRENIGFGSINDINNDAEIISAAKMGGASDIINRIGIDGSLTHVLDASGTELSGGEWQKLSFARALMGNKPIWIFDEPSARQDPISEYNQMKTILSSAKGKTVVLVSHRIGFSSFANRIIVMKDGMIVEDGTHKELMNNMGEYRKMFEEQRQWYDLGGSTLTPEKEV